MPVATASRDLSNVVRIVWLCQTPFRLGSSIAGCIGIAQHSTTLHGQHCTERQSRHCKGLHSMTHSYKAFTLDRESQYSVKSWHSMTKAW